MQCSCGGNMMERRAVATKKGLRLDYCECSTCGRVGGEILLKNDKVIARGNAARKAFNEVA